MAEARTRATLVAQVPADRALAHKVAAPAGLDLVRRDLPANRDLEDRVGEMATAAIKAANPNAPAARTPSRHFRALQCRALFLLNPQSRCQAPELVLSMKRLIFCFGLRAASQGACQEANDLNPSSSRMHMAALWPGMPLTAPPRRAEEPAR